MEKRQSNFELLRIISIMAIIAFHYVFHGNLQFDGYTKNKVLADFIRMFGELGVNCFTLISGYFLVNGKFKVKKLISLVIEVDFYWILLNAINVAVGYANMDEMKYIISWLFPVIFNKYWFITAYILLYLLIPYLNKLIHALDQTEYKYMIYTLLLLFSMIPTVFALFSPNALNNVEGFMFFNRFIWMIVVYFIGAYIRLYDIQKMNNFKKSCMSFLLSTACLFGFIVVVNILLKNGMELTIIPDYFWQPNSMLMACWSLSLFQVFNHLKIGYHPIINYFSKGTLGIYMLHEIVLKSWLWERVFQNATHVNSHFFLIHVGIAVISIFLIGTLIDQIRRLIFSIPTLFVRTK